MVLGGLGRNNRLANAALAALFGGSSPRTSVPSRRLSRRVQAMKDARRDDSETPQRELAQGVADDASEEMHGDSTGNESGYQGKHPYRCLFKAFSAKWPFCPSFSQDLYNNIVKCYVCAFLPPLVKVV